MEVVEYIIILIAFAILANGATFLEPNCGISKSTSRRVSSRVVGGQVADMFGNPWMVYISSAKSSCEGSLITNRFVLTAAHCLTYEYTVVSLGDFDTSSPTDCSDRGCMPSALQIPVDQQIAHPRYVHHSRDDVALLRLARSVEYTDYIRPVCLLTSSYPLNNLRYFTVTGWGITEHGRPSNILKTHTTLQHARSYCASMLNMGVDISHICARSYNSSSCNGDSGSPVTSPLKVGATSRIVQFGIVSTGDTNCNSVEVYTNVMHHMEWIRQVVQQGGSQRPQSPQSPQYPQYPQYPNYPQYPQYPNYPQYPQYQYDLEYPQYTRTIYDYLRNYGLI